ncbi:MAG: tRNA pseudouridine(13) synthase TruD [Candidatus Micrarchaeales archaeon]|jgi:tRNA pseudouridine13 synthase
MLTLTKGRGIGGVIKQTPEDFIVKEIMQNGSILEPDIEYSAESLGINETKEGKHITFVLQKKDWNTINALLAIAKNMRHGRKSIGYAGTKDKKAITVQLASIYNTNYFDMKSVRIKDININGFWRSDGVRMSSNLGNAFDVIIREVSDEGQAAGIAKELNGMMPNYFGEQRFGERDNNPKIGISILMGDLEGAALEYLTGTENERNEGVKDARTRLRNEMNFGDALDYFPRYLKGERTLLNSLVKHPGNYANAIRSLPRGIALMFIHSVQAKIFNSELDDRIRGSDLSSAIFAESDSYGFPNLEKRGIEGKFALAPLIGYETKEEEISDYARESMRDLGIAKESFKIGSVPELRMKGAYRSLFAPVKELSYDAVEGGVKLSFSLPKGAYATVLINEFMKNSDVAKTI